ncbi:MAG: hypothetical protein ABIC04_07745 [Nanoarchaeota archaeon]
MRNSIDCEPFNWTIELYSKYFLPVSLQHMDENKRVIDANGKPMKAEDRDENPYYKGFMLVYGDSRKIFNDMRKMILLPDFGPEEPIKIKNKGDFLEYFGSERKSDYTYFLWTKGGVMIPVKGHMKNHYNDIPPLEQMLRDGALPWNYLSKDGEIRVSDIGGKTQAAIVNSTKFNYGIITANERAYDFGMGKPGLFYGGKLYSDFRFEMLAQETIPYLTPEHNVIGIQSIFEPIGNGNNSIRGQLFPTTIKHAFIEDDKLNLKKQEEKRTNKHDWEKKLLKLISRKKFP